MRFIKLALLIVILALFGSTAFEEVRPLASEAGSQAVLLFDIGMHIEPLGAVPSSLVGGSVSGPGGAGPNYNNHGLFERHVEDIQTVTGIVERHGGVLTVQAQTPFTQVAIESGETILAELEERGHEIGLHFHEDAHLGKNAQILPVKTWCAVLQEEIGLIYQTGVKKHVRYWSGGNLYPGLLDAASCAELDVNSDWKNPNTQRTDEKLIGINPWRPAGGPSETDVTAFAHHDPQGNVIFLPEGLYDRADFASMRRASNGDEAYFHFLKESLENSVAAANPDRVNVFHFTVHPGEFRGDLARPFAIIDQFLTEVIDPLVANGKVRWATFSQMADAFAEWETTHPGVDPRSNSTASQSTSLSSATQTTPTGYMTFAVNVHDWRHIDESADTLLRLIAIFEKYGVRGDFYLTAPMVEFYARERPDVLARLKESGMTISYHVRPPHPLYTGFDQRLRGLSDLALERALRDYETYKLDLATGDLDRSQPGGYMYVAQMLGRAPVVVGAPNNDQRIKTTALKLYKELGGQMAVIYHECCADPNQPFEYRDGLLVRPSDFSITRVTLSSGQENFWWNLLDSPNASQFNPTTLLQNGLSGWQGSRPPFITSLIHENNFYRQGAEGWTLVYYQDREKTQPLPPPFDLNAPDPSQPRSSENQEALWTAYEQLVAYAAAHLRVVTSEDIVAMAETTHLIANPIHTAQSSARVDRDVTYCTAEGVALKMDIYYPTMATSASAPVAMYVHGGGWRSGDKTRGEGVKDIPELVARGYLVAAVNYRLAPRYKFPAMIEDVKCAVRFLHANAAKYHLNPNKIGAWGGSAGGHLVALLGTTDASAGLEGSGGYPEESSRVQAIVDMFGPTDLTQLFAPNSLGLAAVFGTTDPNSEVAQRASPVTWISSDDPPFLILHGERDDVVPVSQSQLFYDQLMATGVPATLVIVKNAGHGFAPTGGPISPSREALTRMMADFFDTHLENAQIVARNP